MTKETLTSDRVNFLIWKYLIESGYEVTARHLQKEWDVKQPTEELPFAPHVGKHALVSILNKGLLFDAYSREASRSFQQHQGLPSQDVSGIPMGVFGPLPLTTNRTIPIIASPQQPPHSNNEDPEIVRKHQLEDDLNSNSNSSGPPGKKPRLTNGYENGSSNGISNGSGHGIGNYYDSASTPMEIDVDQNGDGHAYPSPEQLPSPIIVTNGPEKGTQMDKVSELNAETIYLDLLDDNPSKSTMILHCEWNPRIPKILAAAGTDALARMWDLSRTVIDQTNGTHNFPQASSMNGNVSFPPCTNLLEPLAPPMTYINALTWASDGSYILIASEQLEGSSTVAVWSVKGQLLHTSAPLEAPIICLKWNFSNTLFLSISTMTIEGSDVKGAVFTITSVTDFRTIQHILPQHNLADHPLEAVWTSDEDFIVCGGDVLMAFRITDGVVTFERKFETREDHQLSKITFDWSSKLLATGSETGVIDIWDEQGHSRSFNAHTGLITSLIWQPLQPPNTVNETSERLLASSSEDGAISIWNARSSEPKQKCSMTIGSSSVLALSFTPDGAFIAGGTSDRVLIWKVEDTHLPRASWNRPSGNGWQTPQSSDSIPDEDEHVLSWDVHGQKLAYGCNSMVCISCFIVSGYANCLYS
ncbi:hypothetical protein NHQ30_007475 [Ciborinia camelliae]|nr:hypothetical protein NHQ30_007475 [Ciborinia camelliae]